MNYLRETCYGDRYHMARQKRVSRFKRSFGWPQRLIHYFEDFKSDKLASVR